MDQPAQSKAPVEGRSPAQLAWRKLRQDRTAKISSAIIAFFIILAIIAPVFTWIMNTTPDEFHPETLDPEFATNPIGRFGGISGTHWFGVEPRTGRDVFLRFVYGARTSLTIALTATLVATLIGVIIGLVSGFFGGKTDLVLSRTMEITLAFPSILFALAVTPVLENILESWGLPAGNTTRIPVMIFVLAMFGWPYIARIVRGQVISLREREFVEAARALGASKYHLVFNQILPNLWAPILVTVALNIPTMITAEAALTFLGAGVIDPASDWGAMLLASVPFYSINPTYTFIPGFALFLLVLAFSLLGDSIRDALDPRGSR
ncbi:MAG: ABC transporter permease [Actinobacteria bacterium]|nr:ABC transporter permease [Actinomycetota bacterium]NDF57059.1 ABC transporter permease [Actinomycetota bacterium]NDG25142.1 ABC transporter permease [Actinomycetota bacterium]